MDMTIKIQIDFTKEEVEDLINLLDQCDSEGYMSYGSPGQIAWEKLKEALDEF